MPSAFFPFSTLFDQLTDLVIGYLMAPILYFMVTVGYKSNCYWLDRVFFGLRDYYRANEEALVLAAWHAVHSSVFYHAWYVWRTGTGLDPGEYCELLHALTAAFWIILRPMRRDVIPHGADYNPYNPEEVIACVVEVNPVSDYSVPPSMVPEEPGEESAKSGWRMVAVVPVLSSIGSRMSLFHTSMMHYVRMSQRFGTIWPEKCVWRKISGDRSVIDAGMLVVPMLWEGTPDTRCLYWTWPFFSTDVYHVPTGWVFCKDLCWVLMRAPEYLDVPGPALEELRRAFKEAGVNADEAEEEDEDIQVRCPPEASLFERVCCLCRDDVFYRITDNPVYYFWVAAKSPPFTSHFLSTTGVDIVRTVLDVVTAVGETLEELLLYAATEEEEYPAGGG